MSLHNSSSYQLGENVFMDVLASQYDRQYQDTEGRQSWQRKEKKDFEKKGYWPQMSQREIAPS